MEDGLFLVRGSKVGNGYVLMLCEGGRHHTYRIHQVRQADRVPWVSTVVDLAATPLTGGPLGQEDDAAAGRYFIAPNNKFASLPELVAHYKLSKRSDCARW